VLNREAGRGGKPGESPPPRADAARGVQLVVTRESGVLAIGIPNLPGWPVLRMFFLSRPGPEISTRCTGGVVSALEFPEHQILKMGHRDLLVTATYRDSGTAADDRQCR
jgi:hypothetical protein